MLSVPTFLLRKLYVRGTLRNTGTGFEFRLRNDLGSGYAEQMVPLTLDGQELALESCFFGGQDGVRRFDLITKENPFCLVLHSETSVMAENVSLSDGPHRVELGFRVPGLGLLRFDFEDIASGQGQTGLAG